MSLRQQSASSPEEYGPKGDLH